MFKYFSSKDLFRIFHFVDNLARNLYVVFIDQINELQSIISNKLISILFDDVISTINFILKYLSIFISPFNLLFQYFTKRKFLNPNIRNKK